MGYPGLRRASQDRCRAPVKRRGGPRRTSDLRQSALRGAGRWVPGRGPETDIGCNTEGRRRGAKLSTAALGERLNARIRCRAPVDSVIYSALGGAPYRCRAPVDSVISQNSLNACIRASFGGVGVGRTGLGGGEELLSQRRLPTAPVTAVGHGCRH